MSLSSLLPHLVHLLLIVGVVHLLLSNRLHIPSFARTAIAAAFMTAATAYLLTFDGTTWSAIVLPVGTVIALSSSAKSRVAQEVSEKLGEKTFWLFAASCVLALLVILIHAPGEAYNSSPSEFGIPPHKWVLPNLQLAMTIFYPLLLVYPFAFSRRLKAFLALFAFYSATTIFLYAYLIPIGYPMMSGLSFERDLIDLEMARTRLYKDMLVALVMGGAATWIALRLGARKLSVAVLLVALSLAGISCISLLSASWQRYEPQPASDDAKPYVFSSDRENVLIVYLDRFMGSFVEEILQEKPELLHRLDGFTWYPRTLSAGFNTIVGMPPVIGGYDYMPHIMQERGLPLVDLTTEAFRILPLNFSKKGYDVNFVNPRGLGWTFTGDCRLLNDIKGVRCSHPPPSATARWAERMKMDVIHGSLKTEDYLYVLRRLGGMRGLPYFLKDRIYDDGKWQPVMVEAAGVTFREWAQLKALPELTRITKGKPQFNIVWSILPHEPNYIAQDCQPTKEPVYLTEHELQARGFSSLREFNHYQGAKCSLLIVADYFDKLKELGVYDNTRIVIVSDHGIVNGVEDRSTRAIAGGTNDDYGVATRSVLWVKKEGARGAMATSEEFMPGADVPRIVCEQIGGCVNPYLDNKTIDRHGREDPYVVTFTPWQFSRQYKTKFHIQEQRELRGKDPFDASGWRVIYKGR